MFLRCCILLSSTKVNVRARAEEAPVHALKVTCKSAITMGNTWTGLLTIYNASVDAAASPYPYGSRAVVSKFLHRSMLMLSKASSQLLGLKAQPCLHGSMHGEQHKAMLVPSQPQTVLP